MKHVRDFHSQSWDNPFFARQAGLSRLKKILITLGILLLLAGLVYVFVYSPLLRLRAIEVAGNETIKTEDIQSVTKDALSGYGFWVIPNDHMFALDINGTQNIIATKFLILQKVNVEKKLKKILITVEERKPTLRLIIGERSYLLDQEGIGLREAVQGEGEELIALSQEGLVFVANNKMLPDNQAEKILDLHKYFATLTGVRDRLIGLNPADGSVKVYTNEDWYVVVDLSVDIKTQIGSLSSALLGKFNFEERKRLEYIDIRFGDRIFYKWK